MSCSEKNILREVDLYYTEKIRKFGATHRGVDWNSDERQLICFDQLSKIFENSSERFSVCDFGCGYGRYSQYLEERGLQVDYTGIDVSADMIAAAENLYRGKNDSTFRKGSTLEQRYDYIVADGIFSVRQTISDDDWLNYILNLLNEFDRHSDKGFAFNCLTKYSDADRMKGYLYYADPLVLFDYCKRNFSKNVALLHDYGKYEFTMLVRKVL